MRLQTDESLLEALGDVLGEHVLQGWWRVYTTGLTETRWEVKAADAQEIHEAAEAAQELLTRPSPHGQRGHWPRSCSSGYPL